jgi:hypothetical protein
MTHIEKVVTSNFIINFIFHRKFITVMISDLIRGVHVIAAYGTYLIRDKWYIDGIYTR